MIVRITLLFLILIAFRANAISPINEVLLYPNTESSPSLYLISFTIANQLTPGQYILLNMDWLPNPIDPHHCIFVNESVDISCTNLATPDFPLSFTYETMQTHNPQFPDSSTLVIELGSTLQANLTEHHLQLSLYNNVPNLKKISPSIEIYAINKDGLVYEENLNFGSVIYKPPITNILDVSILNDQSQNEPGQLSTLKVQINISIPVSTPYSTLFFVLQEPFMFSPSSYLNTYESEEYATNPIDLNKAASIGFFEIKSPNIFYAVFDEQFLANRKFIVEITQMSNPFIIAESNISIYSADFNSLTPLQAYESIHDIHTVAYDLDLSVGIPYDMPYTEPCVFMKNLNQYFKIAFNMPKTVPQGYAIKVVTTQITIRYGTAFVNFESLQYTTKYEFLSTSQFVMKEMGPVAQGTLVSITFKGYKNSNTDFFIEVYIDSEEVIDAGTATTYMFYGKQELRAEDYHNFLSNVYDNSMWQGERTSIYNPSSYYMRIQIYARSSWSISTSSGSYVQVYLPPIVEFEADFDPLTDCRFSGTTNSAVCTVTKTSNYVHIIIKSTDSWAASYPNYYTANTNRYIHIYKIKYVRTSSNKYPHMIYARLFNSSAVNPTTYIMTRVFSVVPRRDQLSNINLQQHNDVKDNGFQYPGFLRFQSQNPIGFNFVLQENQVRFLSILSRYGIRGMGVLNNQAYPCTSNIDIECHYHEGHTSSYNNMNEWDRVDIFFPNGNETQNFHIILPDTVVYASDNRYYYMIGAYNELTKDYKYYYRNQYYRRYTGWDSAPVNEQTSMMIDLEGKAGSYRNNVSITVANSLPTGSHNFLVISSAWSLFENGKSSYTTQTEDLPNPTFYSDHLSPLSVLMGDGMYMTVIPFTCSPSLTTFTMWIDNLHMPYHYNLPNYYIYVIQPSSNTMSSYNSFQMTSAGVFYEAPLNSLSLSCADNYLGVLNTVCSIIFGTQSPLKADGVITLVLSGMNIATDVCHVYLPNGTEVQSSCSSTQDNKNVSITMVDTWGSYHYPADNFTLEVSGVSIEADQISQSMTIYLQDSTAKYSYETGTRILTTTVAQPFTIQIYQITYSYNSPLSSNTLSIQFYLPRQIYDDEKLGFVMGKDLSDVNLQIKRLRIQLTRSDGTVIGALHQLLSDQYKVLFTFKDPSQVIASNYTLKIYGIMTPASHQNGAFSIIYQRAYDKGYTLTNQDTTAFPSFSDKIISEISLDALFNTQGYEQRLTFTIVNQEDVVDDAMIWIVNFPSYYYEQLFNFNPYCMIDTAPIQCYADPTTPYQLIIKNSPKIISAQTQYEISIHRLTCPRSIYTNDYYPSRYLFIGILKQETSTLYCETSLLYPQQSIQQQIDGIVSITDLQLTNLNQPSFSSIFTTLFFEVNTDIIAGSFLFLIFPQEFDNFNNQPISIVLKIAGAVVITGNSSVIDRTLQIQITSLITANTDIQLEFPSLPTPRLPALVSMSKMIGYITPADKKSIYAASSESGNSAPQIEFIADSMYISFNYDQTVTITAGTYSLPIDITSSDADAFLTNIQINISSAGFTFEPAQVFLKLGDENGKFRIGADSGLLPINYFYYTTKSQQVTTYYTITKGNNIKVTNIPIQVTVPTSINIPIGGCSQPVVVDIVNPPFVDMSITFNYDNSLYDQDTFWPNPHTTKTQMPFTPNVSTNSLSFCVANTMTVTSFPLKLVLGGTDYRSYSFQPSQNITINVVSNSSTPTPQISMVLANRQRTFLQFNITTNVNGNIYYHLQLGKDQQPLSETDVKVKVKNHEEIIESMDDFMTQRLYVQERDSKVGLMVENAGTTDKTRFSDLLPQRFYTLCLYLETHYNQITQAVCESFQTQQWGTIMKAKVSFSQPPLSDQNLNKILCFFTKQVDTQILYIVDLEGNSCYDRAVSNMYFNYSGLSHTAQNYHTYIYMITDPYRISDPSPTSFQNLFDSDNTLSATTKASAISGFAISYLSAYYEGFHQGIDMIDRATTTKDLKISFDKPEYKNNAIKITNVEVGGGKGTVYFLLILYKQINIDGNNTYVDIRLNEPPTQQQILNCENWQGLPAEGCARAVFTENKITVSFNDIKDKSLYILYYVVASEYPLRPILSETIYSDTIVTFSGMSHLLVSILLTFVALVMI